MKGLRFLEIRHSFETPPAFALSLIWRRRLRDLYNTHFAMSDLCPVYAPFFSVMVNFLNYPCIVQVN